MQADMAGIFGGRPAANYHGTTEAEESDIFLLLLLLLLFLLLLPRSIIVYANRHRRGGGLKQSSRNPALLSRSADFLCSIGERATHRRPTLTPKRRVIGIIRDPEPPRRRAAARGKVHGDRLNAVNFDGCNATASGRRGSVFARVSRNLRCIVGQHLRHYPDRWSEVF